MRNVEESAHAKFSVAWPPRLLGKNICQIGDHMHFMCLALFVVLPHTPPTLGVRVCLGADWHIVRTQQTLVTIVVIIIVIIIFCHHSEMGGKPALSLTLAWSDTSSISYNRQ